jgi:hypothetical protein
MLAKFLRWCNQFIVHNMQMQILALSWTAWKLKKSHNRDKSQNRQESRKTKLGPPIFSNNNAP